jgi:hypothetical protein
VEAGGVGNENLKISNYQLAMKESVFNHSALDATSRKSENAIDHFSLVPDTTLWIPVCEDVS